MRLRTIQILLRISQLDMCLDRRFGVIWLLILQVHLLLRASLAVVVISRLRVQIGLLARLMDVNGTHLGLLRQLLLVGFPGALEEVFEAVALGIF